MRKIFSKKIKAFSLIELSVVIIIVGLLTAGTLVANRLIEKSRLAAAEALAASSPIRNIKENVLWLETSLSDSIDNSQANDGNLVTTWKNQSLDASKIIVTVVGTGPTYSNTINYIHAIKFSGSTDNYLKIPDASFLNNTDYTITVLEKRKSGATTSYFLGENPNGATNQALALGYSGDSTVIHSQGTSSSYTSTVSSSDKPRLFVFTHSSISGNKTYINGVLAAEDPTKTSHLTGISELAIGKGYDGEIGEIAIFTKALTSETRSAVEDYASKKWNRSNNKNAIPNPTACVGLTITDSGCDLSSAPCNNVSMTGILSPMNAASGSSASSTCDVSGYSGTASFSCNNGVTTTTSSCTAITCNITSVTGFSNKTNLPYTTTATAISSPCTTGYSASTTPVPSYTCTTAGNAVITGSCDAITCTASGTGYNKTSLPYATSGSGSFSCDAGYTGTINYTCLTSGAATELSGTCSSTLGCTGGEIDTSTVPGKTIHKFTSVGTFSFTCPTTRNVEVLVVAGGGGGGGGGGSAGGAGGGGGGVIYNSSFAVGTSPATVIVGDGGNGGPGNSYNLSGKGLNGNNSQFSASTTLTAIGGGGAGARENSTTAGSSGGSGGGGGVSGTSKNGGAGTSGQGYAGGANWPGSPNYGGGGGGGAGGVGQRGSSTKGGDGGVGLQYDISGTPTYYGGGGGASYYVTGGTYGSGGNGGGGAVGVAGSPNTGGGGGGGASSASPGLKGGSGIVIIRY